MISEILLENVKKFEGCRLAAYKDAVGVWTIGYGHTRGVHPGDRITQWYADDLLAEDLKIAEKQVLQLGLFPEEGEDPSRYPCTTQGQLDALTDFVFNLGIGRLKFVL